MERLAGKRVLVTAAAAGIGHACAEIFRREGAEVHASDIDGAALEPLRELGIHTYEVDGTSRSAVADCLKAVGTLDSLVHCVGHVHQGTILQCADEEWEDSFRINVDSFYHVLRNALPAMRSAQSGSIVCIASVASSLKGFPNRAAYATTKAALIGLVKSVAADFVSEGIRCNAVCPGTITSPSLERRIEALARQLGDTERATAMYVERQPMKRLGTPDEVASLCLYLVSAESEFVTGQAFAVDGGITL